jgi:hypothetical protein
MTELWCAAESFAQAPGPVAVPLRLCCVQRLLGRAASVALEIRCSARPSAPAPPASVFSGLTALSGDTPVSERTQVAESAP